MDENIVDLEKVRYEKAIQERMKEYANTHESGLNNLRKNMSHDRKSMNDYFSRQLPVDEMATMGSDTQGVVRDHRNMNPDLKSRWDKTINEIDVKEQAAKRLLKEKGYEEVYIRPTKKNPTYRTVFKHPVTGKVLKALSTVGLVGAALTAPSADAAVMDAIVPGGVESMGVSDEQKILDERYQEAIRRRAK